MTKHMLKDEEFFSLSKEPEFHDQVSVEYRDHMGTDHSIVEAMMVSTEGITESLDPAADEGRLRFMMRERHGSPFEQAAIKVHVWAPIFVFREWHRHRIGFSYNEVSGRYKVLEPNFYIPPRERGLTQVGKHSSPDWIDGGTRQWAETSSAMREAYWQSWLYYKEMVESGVTKEVARAVLGTGIYTEMITTLNPRSCMSFLSLRQRNDDGAFRSFPQWEINQCADQLEEIFQDLFPLTHKLYVENGRVAP